MTETHRTGRDRIVVGYIAEPRGYDALALASFLARGTDAEVIITMVTPEPSAYAGHMNIDPGIDPIVKQQLDLWMRDAIDRLPEGIRAIPDQRVASSDAHGLLDAATQYDAPLIVIGAQAVALLRQFTIGTVASTLLHASHVPVALAPGGFADEASEVTRVTAIFGTKPGADEVIGRAVERAVARNVPLRLLSLVQVDRSAPSMDEEVVDRVRAYGGERLAEAGENMLADGRATVEVIEGRDLDDAITRVEWIPGEFAMIGSSRLGQGGRVFLGNKAMRILRRVPVPVIVVPRGFEPVSTEFSW